MRDFAHWSQKKLEKSLPRRWKHTRGVAARADQVASVISESDRNILIGAALLHDIGYAPDLAKTGFHPLDGARFLRYQGAPERLCALVAHHSCAYREAELRGLSAELAEWEDEKTPLRDALWWADMTAGPDGQRMTVHERLAEIAERYGPDDLVTVFVRQAAPELVGAVERTEARLRAAGIQV